MDTPPRLLDSMVDKFVLLGNLGFYTPRWNSIQTKDLHCFYDSSYERKYWEVVFGVCKSWYDRYPYFINGFVVSAWDCNSPLKVKYAVKVNLNVTYDEDHLRKKQHRNWKGRLDGEIVVLCGRGCDSRKVITGDLISRGAIVENKVTQRTTILVTNRKNEISKKVITASNKGILVLLYEDIYK